MEHMMMPRAIAPVYYGWPQEASPERRQQGHFMPPRHHMTVFPVVPTLPSTPIYSRPNSSGAQPPMPHPHKMLATVPSNITPVASPQPCHNMKPTIALDTGVQDFDGLYTPSTPPLSSSGSSVISRSDSWDMLHTPLNPMFSGWAGGCTSPPMTPVYLPPQAPAPELLQNHLDRVSSHLSASSNSSSLRRSSFPPTPVTPPADDLAHIDFCDPRNLTVGIASPSGLGDDDEDYKFVLQNEAFVKAAPLPLPLSPPTVFEFASAPAHGPPSLHETLESEDALINSLFGLQEEVPASSFSTRSRASSDAPSLGHSSFSCPDLEDFDTESFKSEYDYLCLPEDSDDLEAHPSKRQRMDACAPVINTTSESQSENTQQQTTPAPEQQQSNNTSDESKDHSKANTPSGDNNGDTPSTPQQTTGNRRGRKQSLTEDPSKTFVCELCSRRFRRQEHLKRHYRSLHTQDKPFECHECSKTFSRSDNLAQHARTHGSGAIVMNLIDDPEAMAMHHSYMMSGHHMPSHEDYRTYGKVLFQAAAEIPGSGSDYSDEGSDGEHRKRKRMD